MNGFVIFVTMRFVILVVFLVCASLVSSIVNLSLFRCAMVCFSFVLRLILSSSRMHLVSCAVTVFSSSLLIVWLRELLICLKWFRLRNMIVIWFCSRLVWCVVRVRVCVICSLNCSRLGRLVRLLK